MSINQFDGTQKRAPVHRQQERDDQSTRCVSRAKSWELRTRFDDQLLRERNAAAPAFSGTLRGLGRDLRQEHPHSGLRPQLHTRKRRLRHRSANLAIHPSNPRSRAARLAGCGYLAPIRNALAPAGFVGGQRTAARKRGVIRGDNADYLSTRPSDIISAPGARINRIEY